MSDPLEKLGQTCEILGDDCKVLVKKHNNKEIDDIGFVNKYFDLLESYPDKLKRDKIAKELSDYTKENFMTKESIKEDGIRTP